MELYNLRVNHVKEALGFFLGEKPTVSFQVRDTYGKKLKSVTITVADNEKMKTPIYISGEILEEMTVYPIQAEFTPYAIYYYQVRAVSDIGEEALAVSWFETGKMNEGWNAEWITPEEKRDVMLVGKEFSVNREVKKARIYIGCAGVYELELNGEKVGKEYLTPYSNDYYSWMQVITHDITKQLQKGINVIEAIYSHGWYGEQFGLASGKFIYGDTNAVIAEIHIQYADGAEEVISTDESWYSGKSPCISGEIYHGTVYDFSYDCSKTGAVSVCDIKKEKLMDRLSLPVLIKEERLVAEVFTTPKGELCIDIGQNMTGWLRIDTSKFKDKDFRIQYFEVLDSDGNFYNKNLRSARAEFVYKTDGTPRIIEAKFTYYGFRYAKIDGLDEIPMDAFTGCVVYSDMEQTGVIETSNSLVNRLFLNALWGQKDNFLDVPTDCPQRDERMGWTGDAQVFCGTANFNMDVAAFYNKFIYDMWMEQQRNNGVVPYYVPFVRGSEKGRGSAATSAAWGDAATIIPWTCYIHTGDKEALKKHYPSMKAWVEHIRSQEEDNHLWKQGFHLGDWLALDNVVKYPPMGLTPKDMVASAYYLYSTKLLSKAAKALGKKEEQKEYEELARQIKTSMQKEYVTETGRIASDTQTANILALFMDFATDEKRAAEMLNEKIMAVEGGHLNTGFVGTTYICRALSDHGFNKTAYKLLLNKDCPSWLYAVERGATTIWERWDSILPDGSFGKASMNSFNHYSYGAVMEWVYRNVAGIQPMEEYPGFRRIKLMPQPDNQLEWVKVSYDSVCGCYSSSWKIEKEKLWFKFKVPFGGGAYLTLPDAPEIIKMNENDVEYLEGMFLEPGTYEISYMPTQQYYVEYSIYDNAKKILGNSRLKAITEKYVPAVKQLPKHIMTLPYEGNLLELFEQHGILLEDGTKQKLKEELGEIRTWAL